MNQRLATLALVLGALALAGCGSSSSSSSTSATASTPGGGTGSASTPTTTTAQVSFENVPIEQGPEIAPAGTTQTGDVDGIKCGATEQLAYHIHAHLAVFVNGASRTLPGGIGIPGSVVQPTAQGPEAAGGQCIYWLHTHAPDGVIHVESPTQRIYTLGNFFDEWHQALTPGQVGNALGKVTAIVNGKPWTKSPREIPLDPHATIQLNLGRPPAAFQTIDWASTQL
jgi:hypothetical protein